MKNVEQLTIIAKAFEQIADINASIEELKGLHAQVLKSSFHIKTYNKQVKVKTNLIDKKATLKKLTKERIKADEAINNVLDILLEEEIADRAYEVINTALQRSIRTHEQLIIDVQEALKEFSK